MSKSESAGYQEKLAWLKARFPEGLKLKMIARGGRGFIEYIPGEFAWRAIRASRYMVIHCLWVVGKAEGKGSGKALLDSCIHEAYKKKMLGVAAVTARGKVGLVDTDFFLCNGFQVVETAPPGLDLVAMKFGGGPNPRFLRGSNKKLGALGQGLSIVSSPQCPYTLGGAEQIAALARSMNIPARTLRLDHIEEIRSVAPSGYASFNIVCNGKVVSNLFHCMTDKILHKVLAS